MFYYLTSINMKLWHSSLSHLFCLMIHLIFLLPCVVSQACQKTCGKQLIKYPFGTGPGCGDLRFQSYVNCNQNQLTFTSHTGCYPITSIDYKNQVVYISDPSMSTCSCAQPSKGFGLDWNAPFTFHDNSVFALLDCSASSSPIYNSNGGGNSSAFPLCDSQGTSICSLLFSCQAVSRLDVPISSCCVYTPVDLGPSFDMDLQKLHCSAYTGLFGYNGQESDPESWSYGVALKYKFNFNNDYPKMCDKCEKSNGICGYDGPYSSFSCNCPGGLNISTDCFFGSWSNSLRLLPWQTGAQMIYALAWLIALAMV